MQPCPVRRRVCAGRPSTPAAKQAVRTKKRLEAQRAGLFTHRYLFVQRHLNTTERKTLWGITRDLPQLRMLRTLMEQVYALFDRRCRTQTALDKLGVIAPFPMSDAAGCPGCTTCACSSCVLGMG